VALEVERLGPGSERPFQNATLERMHGGRRDAIGNDSESGLPVDLRDGINQLEVLRCVHDAPVTMNERPNSRSRPQQSARRSGDLARLGSQFATSCPWKSDRT